MEKTEARLQWLTSFFEDTESKYEDIIKHLQGEPESMLTFGKEKNNRIRANTSKAGDVPE